MICGVLALGTVDVQAARKPYSQDGMEKGAILIVTGGVVAMTSKTQKSKFKRALGIHRDRVYTIELKVASIPKGAGVLVVAFR